MILQKLKVAATYTTVLTEPLGTNPSKLIQKRNELPPETVILASDIPVPARRSAPAL